MKCWRRPGGTVPWEPREVLWLDDCFDVEMMDINTDAPSPRRRRPRIRSVLDLGESFARCRWLQIRHKSLTYPSQISIIGACIRMTAHLEALAARATSSLDCLRLIPTVSFKKFTHLPR